jgi:hypothetical protein
MELPRQGCLVPVGTWLGVAGLVAHGVIDPFFFTLSSTTSSVSAVYNQDTSDPTSG